ncbi:glycosyltransferase [Propioniciclava soli]|uniref:Glycosyltransferase n=1 Tax=Propioniciclava soli TaxID=2775081 RepID=A0ABZ3C9P5_9ACTN|nr:glycosyltransferase [Propioniciclava soli]
MTAPTSGDLAVAYLVSQYPALSHTFIEREIVGLRAQGVRVLTVSVRRPDPAQLRTQLMREEADATVVLQADVPAALRSNAAAVRRAPRAFAAASARALRSGEARPASRCRQLAYLAEASVLLDQLRAHRIRHVHAHFANNGADIARLAVALGNAEEGEGVYTWSFTMHGPTEFEAVERFDLAGKVRDAARVACISDFTRSQLMRLVGTQDWDKLDIVRMTVETDRFVPPTGASRAAEGPFRILSVGRLVPEKGAPVLIDAIARLVERGVDAHARLVGGGELEPVLRAEIGRRGLTDRVTLVGPVGQDDILAEYHGADVFCLPSFQEGLPVVLMEAMATGLPVVTTTIAGIGDLVTDRVTGRLVAPGRADLLADALAELAADPARRAAWGAAGRDAVVTEFGVETNAVRMRDFLARAGAAR